MKKRGLLGSLALAALMMILISSSGFAYLPPHLHSGWAAAAPTINGVIAVGEWATATAANFQLVMRSRSAGALMKTLNGTFYVENDWNNLYIAVKILNDTYNASDMIGQYKGLSVLFEDNHNGLLEVGDNGMGVETYSAAHFYSDNDLFYQGANVWEADHAIGVGKTNDGALNWSHTNPIPGQLGDWTFEMRVPLVGTDGDAYDFNITSLPVTIGFKLWFKEVLTGTDGVFPDDPTILQNVYETVNATTYGELTIHPLYTLTIQTTVGGTTNPAPGQYQYPYLADVPVTAIPDPGYHFSHWELDLVNVGALSPYHVIMDQNHTLKAFFEPNPPAPTVGGSSFELVPTNLTPPTALYIGAIVILGAGISIIKRKKR